MGVGGQCHTLAALPAAETLPPSPEFNPRIAQPVASRYTDCTLPVQYITYSNHQIWRFSPR